MGRSPCCAKEGLNRGAWTAIEDKILTDYINANGEGKWRNLPKKAGLKRCGKSCRLRWLNYLRPDIKRGNISADEEELIIRLHKLLGNRWSLIAGRLPGRTDNEIKNYWNTNLGKKVQDPQISNKQQEKKADITSSAASFVIRTKATKCSRVVLDREFHKPQQPNHCHTHTETTPSKDVHGGLLSRDNPVGSLFPIEENNDNSSQDFGMDFNLGELNGLSELLDTEFSDFFKFNSELSSSGNELPPMFSKGELLQNWTAQPFVASNFNPFASLLDSAGDWLGESN